MNSANTPLLETERLILRKFTENDLEALFNIYSNEEVNTYLPWFPLTSLEEAASLFKEKYREVYKRPYGYHYAICPKTATSRQGISTQARTTAMTSATDCFRSSGTEALPRRRPGLLSPG